MCERWQKPDQGIWEMRGAPQHFVASKVMCWVAIDRGISMVHQHFMLVPVLTVAENILFGMPVDRSLTWDTLAEHPYLVAVIEKCGLTDDFLRIGLGGKGM